MRFVRHHDDMLLGARPPRDFSEVELMAEQAQPRRYRPSVVNIDSSALEHNVDEIKKLVKPSKLAVAVKANAYGHGIVPISKRLQAMGVDMLCVATAEEALLLRRNEITAPIFLLCEPPRDAIGPCYLNDITFCVYTIDTINTIAAFANKDRPAHVHLQVDTGMNRVGVHPNEALTFARHISKHDSLNFEGVFTHFATADEPTHPGTSLQLEKFERVLDDIEMAGLTPTLIHAANSAAALRIPSSRFSMVRMGISVYGVYPEPRCADIIDLRLVLSLTTSIMFLKTIQPGETVSYGARFEAERETRIATLPIGYGDGVPMNLGLSGGSVIIFGVRCPIVGRVTMDQMMVDVTNLSVGIGDKVTLLGTEGNVTISPTEWGDLTGTISYEILCRLGERLDRVYD